MRGGHHDRMTPLARIGTLVAACLLSAGAARSATQPGILHGIVKKGPIAPVCRVGQPCDAPVRVTLRFTRPGTNRPLVHTVRSNANGTYRIALPPGLYTVSTSERIGIDHLIRPRTVRVRSGHSDEVDLFIDTGIR